MNLVLYRKYRPKIFSEVVGQEHVVQTLTNALSSGALSHAYLFTGPRGCGKTTIARLLAKALNCQNRKEGEFEPCGKCDSCLEIAENRSIDLIEIDAASHRGIDEMKELIDGVKFTPTKSKYKVFIIDESHQLTKEAANALLKTLEEPPSHAVFILATTEAHKMIPTIVSRCQRFDFRKLRMEELIKRLEMLAQIEKIKIDKPAIELLALNAGGSVRDAESLLGQVLSFGAGKDGKVTIEEVKGLLGLVETTVVSQFVDYLVSKDGAGALNYLNEIIEKGSDLGEFAKALINYLRQGLILKVVGQEGNSIIVGLTKEELENLRSQVSGLKEEEVRKMLDLFLGAEARMKYSSIPQLPLELVIIEISEIK